MRALGLLLALALAGCSPLTPLDRGLQLYNEGRYFEAVAAFDEAVQETPEAAAAYSNRGVTRIRLGDARGAVEDFTRALALTPDDPEILFNRGNARVIVGEFTLAVGDFTRAATVRPDFSRAVFNRGLAWERAGNHAGALADWRRAIELEPDPRVRAAMERRVATAERRPGPPAPDPHALADRGLRRELEGDRAGAIADLEAALSVETDAQRRAGIENLLRLLREP